MKLSETNYDNGETGCCARLDVDRWDEHEFTWENKRFLKDHVRALFHVPLNFGKVMRQDQAAVESAEGFAPEPLWLSDEKSLWGSDVYMAVDRDIPDSEMTSISGTFLTKVFEGPYRDAGKWAASMTNYVQGKGHELKKLYFYYATCPKCTKHFGKNHVVLFAQIN